MYQRDKNGGGAKNLKMHKDAKNGRNGRWPDYMVLHGLS